MVNINKLIQTIVGASSGKYILNWLVGHRGASFQAGINVLVDGATLTPDCSLGECHQITAATNGTRAFAAPTNLSVGAEFETEVINTSGGALTVTTWAASYSPVAPTLPATGNRRTQRWRWDGTTSHLVFQTAADVAN